MMKKVHGYTTGIPFLENLIKETQCLPLSYLIVKALVAFYSLVF